MPDVIKIVLKLVNRVFFVFAVGIVDLRPAGDARLDQMAKVVKRDLLFVALDTFFPFRSRTDQAHVAFEHVPQLRELIEPQSSEPFSYWRNSGIVLARVKVVFSDV